MACEGGLHWHLVTVISGIDSDSGMLEAVVKNLAGRGHSRPRKVTTLTNSINSLFTEDLGSSRVASLVRQLEELGHITISDGKVSYDLKA